MELRARVIAVGCPLAVVATVVALLSQRQFDSFARIMIQVGVAIGLAVIGVAAAAWGARMDDRAYAVLIYGGFLLSSMGVMGRADPGQVMRAAVCFVIDVVLGAIFFELRRWVVTGVVLAVTLLAIVAVLSRDNRSVVMDFSISAVCLVVVGASVRLLRELAVSALVESRRSEVTDPLTGLVNRRGLERLVGPLWRQRAHDGRSLLVIVVDVDHFKRINDTQGHAAGDEVLRRLGGLLSESIRDDDLAVRLGGEEFLVLADSRQDGAQRIAERLRRIVEESLGPVTVSIGVHEARPLLTDPLPESVWSAVALADSALYEAKGRGRNRVALTPTLAAMYRSA
jgi:diguanylate cyclase (GGDEF)-like protein